MGLPRAGATPSSAMPPDDLFRYDGYVIDSARQLRHVPLRHLAADVQGALHLRARRRVGGPRCPGGCSPALPGGRGVVLQDDRRAGHRPRLPGDELSRAVILDRVLHARPRRIRLPQPHRPAGPPGHRSGPVGAPRAHVRTRAGPAADPLRRRHRLHGHRRRAFARPSRRRPVRGQPARQPLRGDRGRGQCHRTAGAPHRTRDRPVGAALSPARLLERSRAGYGHHHRRRGRCRRPGRSRRGRAVQ